MHARVTTFKARLEKVNDGAQFFQTVFVDVREMPGFIDGYFLVDRTTGDAMTVALWESEDAMQASRETVGGIWARAADMELMDGPPSPKLYEVGAHAGATLDTAMTD